MERKNYMTRVLIAVLFIISLIAFVLPVNGQTQNINNTTAGAQTSYMELSSGSWVLIDRKTEVYNRANVTKWSGSDQNLLALCQWKDIMNIEHTISNGFKWADPPRSMAPGKDFKIALDYINDEYSTDNRVLTGIDVKLDYIGADYLTVSKNGYEAGKLVKDNKNYNNETKTVFFSAPKTFLGETNQMQLMVDCFIGQDHYVTTYTYSYTNEESAAK